MLRRGCLSYPELVRRGLGVEEMNLARNTPVSPIMLLYPGMYGPTALASHTTDVRGDSGAGCSGPGAGVDIGGGVGGSMYLELTQAAFVLPTQASR